MNTLLVGYDLNKAGQNYEKLIEKLKSYGTWWHHLDSTWVIKTEKTSAQVRDELGTLIDANDELLVVNITGAGASWRGFNERGSKWLKDNF